MPRTNLSGNYRLRELIKDLTIISRYRMNRSQHLKLILILGALAALGPFSIDMYLPSFNAIARDYNTDVSHVGLTLTSFFIGISLGQILCGPLIDRFGRRRPLLFGLLLYFVSAIACANTWGLYGLVVTRFTLALGSCVGMVASRAIVRDRFAPAEIPKVFSTLMLVMAAAPILAPSVGSFFAIHFGWRMIFYFLAGFTLLLGLTVFFALPETRPPNPAFSLRPAALLRDYGTVLNNRSFLIYALIGGLSMAASFAYISGTPDLFMNYLHLDSTTFAWVFGLNALGFIGSAQINQFILRYYSPQRVVLACLLLAVFAVVGLVCISAMHVHSVPAYSALIFVFMCCMGPIVPNTSALALTPFRDLAGCASAMIGSIQMGLAALSSASVSRFGNGTPLPTTTILLICVGGSMVIAAASHIHWRVRHSGGLSSESAVTTPDI